MQICQDAASLAAHEVFQMGEGRAMKFADKFKDYCADINSLVFDDLKDDHDFVYAKAMIDESLKKIFGDENFCPWDERYQEE